MRGSKQETEGRGGGVAGADLGLDGDVGLEGEFGGEGALELQHVLVGPRVFAAGDEFSRAGRSWRGWTGRALPCGELRPVDADFVEGEILAVQDERGIGFCVRPTLHFQQGQDLERGLSN